MAREHRRGFELHLHFAPCDRLLILLALFPGGFSCLVAGSFCYDCYIVSSTLVCVLFCSSSSHIHHTHTPPMFSFAVSSIASRYIIMIHTASMKHQHVLSGGRYGFLSCTLELRAGRASARIHANTHEHHCSFHLVHSSIDDPDCKSVSANADGLIPLPFTCYLI